MQKERLIPTFARVNISLKNTSFKLERKIATLIMETAIKTKHSEKQS